MNLSLNIDPSTQALGEPAQRLSQRVAFALAGVLQTLGISRIDTASARSMSGPVRRMAWVDIFGDTPVEISVWSEAAAQALVPFMQSLGITGLSLVTQGEDGSPEQARDMEPLYQRWSQIAGRQIPPPPPPPPQQPRQPGLAPVDSGSLEIQL